MGNSMYFIIGVVFCINLVSCLLNKGSLTFVVDDSASMLDEIKEIKDNFESIYNVAMNSSNPRFENLVLVTFNDPSTQVRAVTKDREVFKNALSSIDVIDGHDCPEYAMSGIKTALEQSLPGSILYVFTDASAKDYDLYDEVKTLALQRRSQIIFILTGNCGSEDAPGYQVYNKLAADTSGQGFITENEGIKQVLGSLQSSVAEIPTVQIRTPKSFPPGDGHKYNYVADEKTKELFISVTGETPTIDITGPDGTKLTAERVLETVMAKILKVPNTKPGTYVIEISSRSGASVVVNNDETSKLLLNLTTV